MAPSDSRSVNRCGHGHLACKFPINVTVPSEEWRKKMIDVQATIDAINRAIDDEEKTLPPKYENPGAVG